MLSGRTGAASWLCPVTRRKLSWRYANWLPNQNNAHEWAKRRDTSASSFCGARFSEALSTRLGLVFNPEKAGRGAHGGHGGLGTQKMAFAAALWARTGMGTVHQSPKNP